jgi:hypothetical protein
MRNPQLCSFLGDFLPVGDAYLANNKRWLAVEVDLNIRLIIGVQGSPYR